MTRLHPFEHFADIVEIWFTAIRDEVEAQQRDPRDRVRFATLPSVQRTLQDIEDPAFLEDHPTAVEDYLAALFATFTYWHAGQNTVVVTQEQLEQHLADLAAWSRVPSEDHDMYVQLPPHMFWSQIDETAPLEPVDGMFVSANTKTRELSLLAVLGLRKERDNFSQIHVVAAFEDLEGLPDELPSALFEPVVDGVEAAGVKSVKTAGEALLLALVGLATSPPSPPLPPLPPSPQRGERG